MNLLSIFKNPGHEAILIQRVGNCQRQENNVQTNDGGHKEFHKRVKQDFFKHIEGTMITLR